MRLNGTTILWLRLVLAFSLGVGSAVAGTFLTFETSDAHRTDVQRIESMLGEIRGDVKILLGRVPPGPRVPRTRPHQGDGRPVPLQEASP